MSHELWARRFAANPGLVGRTIEVNNLTVTVAGILPAGYGGLRRRCERRDPVRADSARRFAALAVLLSLVGLYGVVAYTTLQRTREIGIRIALGASRADIVRLVIGGGLSWAAAGIAAGTLTALALTRSLRTLLFGVAPGDPLTIGAVAIALTAVTLLASYAPASRATRIPASDALRAE
jgi:hypothetical protein